VAVEDTGPPVHKFGMDQVGAASQGDMVGRLIAREEGLLLDLQEARRQSKTLGGSDRVCEQKEVSEKITQIQRQLREVWHQLELEEGGIRRSLDLEPGQTPVSYADRQQRLGEASVTSDGRVMAHDILQGELVPRGYAQIEHGIPQSELSIRARESTVQSFR